MIYESYRVVNASKTDYFNERIAVDRRNLHTLRYRIIVLLLEHNGLRRIRLVTYNGRHFQRFSRNIEHYALTRTCGRVIRPSIVAGILEREVYGIRTDVHRISVEYVSRRVPTVVFRQSGSMRFVQMLERRIDVN